MQCKHVTIKVASFKPRYVYNNVSERECSCAGNG